MRQNTTYGVRLAAGMLQTVEGLALQGMSASHIHQMLERKESLRQLPASSVPSLRTIERIVKQLPERQPNEEPEDFGVPAPSVEDVRAALDALAELVIEGTAPWPVKSVRREMASLIRLAPGLSADALFRLALWLSSRKQTGKATDDLEAWIAFRPWVSEGKYFDYVMASQYDRVPRLPYLDPMPSAQNQVAWEEGFWDPLLGKHVDWRMFQLAEQELRLGEGADVQGEES